MVRRMQSTVALGMILIASCGCGRGQAQEPHAATPTPTPPAVVVPASTPGAPIPMGVNSGCDPIVIADCRLAVVEKEQIPSQRDGVLLLIGTEIKPGEVVPPERIVTVSIGGQEKKFRRLREGDAVEAGQLVALMDDRLTRDDCAIRQAQIALSEADLAATENARDEARERYLAQMKLRSSPTGPATSEEDLGNAKVIWFKHHCEAIAKKEATTLARLELHQTQTLLAMHEVRSAIPGVIKRIYKNPGEAVKSLEPVVEIHNLGRLRAEGLVDVQHLSHLREGMQAYVDVPHMQSPQQIVAGHRREVTGVAIAGPRVLSASEDGTVRVWDRNTRREERVLRHPAGVRAAACTAAGELCLAGCADGSAWLWDLTGPANGPPRELKVGHQGAVTCVAICPDGKSCATAGEDRAICLWDVASATLRYRLPPGHLGAITTLQYPLPGRLVSAGQDNTLRIWALGETGARLENTLDHRSGDVTQLGVSRDGALTLFDQVGTIQLISLPTGAALGMLQQPSGSAAFTTLALLSPDARLILTAGTSEGRLHLWRTPTGSTRAAELGQFLPPPRSTPTCAAFAADGTFVAAGTREGQILIWSLPAADALEQRHPATVTLIEQTTEPNGRQVRLWAELANPGGRLAPGTSVTLTLDPEH